MRTVNFKLNSHGVHALINKRAEIAKIGGVSLSWFICEMYRKGHHYQNESLQSLAQRIALA